MHKPPTKKFVTTRLAVAELHPVTIHGVRKFIVFNSYGLRIGVVEKLDTGRWLTSRDRLRTHSTVGRAVEHVQRAAQ